MICALILAFGTPAEAGGRPSHWRLQTAHGPVHVWTPAQYDPDTAGVVVYIHGYFDDVDTAWRSHRLAQQFRESGLNAMFIACEAPDGPRDDVKWESLDELLATVAGRLKDELPAGRVVVVGHSGAHRTISEWLADDRIDTLVLVDALYDKTEQVRDWLDADEDRRLIDAAVVTRPWTETLHAELPETLVFDRFPSARTGRLEGAREARVVYVRSQHDHMSLVTGGIALPMLLRAVDLPAVRPSTGRLPESGEPE